MGDGHNPGYRRDATALSSCKWGKEPPPHTHIQATSLGPSGLQLSAAALWVLRTDSVDMVDTQGN